MLNKNTGMPKEGDIVFCTITKIQYHSVFASLDEYDRKSGMIHISEISPGRIRNINDYVREGKVVICKVLRINKERGHIDLSLRRVNESQRRAKVEERKQQTIAENILQSYKQLHKDVDIRKLYDDVTAILLKDYPTLYAAFEDVVENDAKLADHGLEKKLAQELETVVRERIKPKQVEIAGTLKMESYAGDGVDLVNKFVVELDKLSVLLKVQFLGAGNFKLVVIAPDYEQAEAVMKQVDELIKKHAKKSADTSISFERD